MANMGLYASPERLLLFDVNDFDETLPGPFEWDVKRLVTSFVIAGRTRGFSEKQTRRAAFRCAASYRDTISRLAGKSTLDIWYTKIDESSINEFARSVAVSNAVRSANRPSCSQGSLADLALRGEEADRDG